MTVNSLKRVISVLTIALIAACCIISVTGCRGNEMSYKSMKKKFEKDFDALDAVMKSEQYDDLMQLGWIKDVDVHEAENFIDCYCGGSGMGSQTNYTGFVYTPDDDPLSMWRQNGYNSVLTPADFVKTEDGWEYSERDHDPNGDNLFIIKKLAPCYYYYYLHY